MTTTNTDDTARMLDQIEAVLRAITSSKDSVFTLCGYRTEIGDRGDRKHRWMLCVSLRTDAGAVRLSEVEASVDRPHRAGAPSWEVPPAPAYAERVAALHAAVMARLEAHEKAIVAARAVRVAEGGVA